MYVTDDLLDKELTEETEKEIKDDFQMAVRVWEAWGIETI